jgi:hypothetical protein
MTNRVFAPLPAVPAGRETPHMKLGFDVFLGLDAVMQGPGALDEDTSGGLSRRQPADTAHTHP